MKEYSVWLSMVKHVSNRKKYQLLAAFGSAEAVYRASSVELASEVSGLTSKDIEALSDDSMEEAEDICRACRRIAAGSGTTVQEVNILLRQFEQTREMMKRFGKMKKGRMRMPF